LVECLPQVDVAVADLVAPDEDDVDHTLRYAVAVGRVGHDSARLRVAQPVEDAVVAVEDGHRQQDRPALVGAEEDGGGLGQRREQRGDAVLALDAVRLEDVRELVRQVLELTPVERALVALPVLPDHRELSRACLSQTSDAML